jgi:IS1 family transposase
LFRYQDDAFRNLKTQRIQVDEMWAFIYAKDKNVTAEMAAKHEGAGNIWLWIAIDADTKIVPCWYLGDRGQQSGHAFMSDLAARLSNRVQLTSDGHRAYLEAVDYAFGSDVDYSQMIKVYGSDRDRDVRYSPGKIISSEVMTRG